MVRLFALQMSWQQKVEEEKKRAAADGKLKEQLELTLPTLQNVNEDPFLTGKIVCVLKEGISSFGRPEGEEPPTFRIGGLGVVAAHASVNCIKVQNDEEDPDDVSYNVVITVKGKTMINGEEIAEGGKRQLQHKDRILFGHNNLYVYVDPFDIDKVMPSWEDAMKEVKRSQMSSYGDTQKREEENEREEKYQKMLKEVENEQNQLEQERNELLRKLEKKEKELLASGESKEVIEQKLRVLQEEKQAVERELQKKRTELEEKELRIKKEKAEDDSRKEEERAAKAELEAIMTRTSLLVDEANMIAQELGVGTFFSPKLIARGDAIRGGKRGTLAGTVMQRSEIMIRVDSMDLDITQLWPLDLFERKVFEMREIYANWFPEAGQSLTLPDDVANPFAPDPESYQVRYIVRHIADLPRKNVGSVKKKKKRKAKWGRCVVEACKEMYALRKVLLFFVAIPSNRAMWCITQARYSRVQKKFQLCTALLRSCKSKAEAVYESMVLTPVKI